MSKLLGVILAVVLLIVGVVLANAAAKPDTFRVERTMSIDMDRMVGQDFEAGLANLKVLAERQGA